MAVKSYKVGPGVLTIGQVAGSLDFTSQVTSAKVAWSVSSEDDEPTLSGDVLAGDRTYTAELSATLIQDLTAGGLIEWSWDHKGESLPFSYTPSTTVGRAITGTVTVDPIDVGGDVNSKPKSDVTWACVGEPVLGDSLV